MPEELVKHFFCENATLLTFRIFISAFSREDVSWSQKLPISGSAHQTNQDHLLPKQQIVIDNVSQSEEVSPAEVPPLNKKVTIYRLMPVGTKTNTQTPQQKGYQQLVVPSQQQSLKQVQTFQANIQGQRTQPTLHQKLTTMDRGRLIGRLI